MWIRLKMTPEIVHDFFDTFDTTRVYFSKISPSNPIKKSNKDLFRNSFAVFSGWLLWGVFHQLASAENISYVLIFSVGSLLTMCVARISVRVGQASLQINSRFLRKNTTSAPSALCLHETLNYGGHVSPFFFRS